MARAWLSWWVVLAALYLWLADNAVLPELVVGAVVAAIGASGAVLVRGQRRTRLRPRLRWLRGVWRPLFGVFGDLVPLARALARRRPGALVESPLGGPADDPAYVALTEALGSLAPNTLVVDVDRERGVVLAHQLVPTRDPASAAAPLRS
jgi:multisubunit Na+/H+ antiporter MnhE subunit